MGGYRAPGESRVELLSESTKTLSWRAARQAFTQLRTPCRQPASVAEHTASASMVRVPTHRQKDESMLREYWDWGAF